MVTELTLREEITGIIESLKTAWNKENITETLDTLLEEGWVEDLPISKDLKADWLKAKEETNGVIRLAIEDVFGMAGLTRDLLIDGEIMFLPTHMDLQSGHTIQIKLPLTFHREGAELVRPNDLIDMLVLAGEALQSQDDYALMSVQVNADDQWEGVFIGEEGMEEVDG